MRESALREHVCQGITLVFWSSRIHTGSCFCLYGIYIFTTHLSLRLFSSNPVGIDFGFCSTPHTPLSFLIAFVWSFLVVLAPFILFIVRFFVWSLLPFLEASAILHTKLVTSVLPLGTSVGVGAHWG